MKIAIIGAGFTGLSAGYRLAKKGHEVTIFEKDSILGGLASGFSNQSWNWTLEKHYHHCFSNDYEILSLTKEINFPMVMNKPDTSVYINGKIYKFDSPIDVLKFPEINLLERLRMGVIIALIKYNPFWKPLEKYNASDVLPKLMGENAYKALWKPLIIKKFGPFASNISMAWFWARLVKRTPLLIYPKGGYLKLANAIATEIKKKGGKIKINNEIRRINTQEDGKRIKINNMIFDKAIVTLPSLLFAKITPQLPSSYRKKLMELKELSAVNLILRLKKPFFQNATYWLNICDTNYPLTGIVEHTNFIDKKNYNNESLVYLLNYLPQNHRYLKMDKSSLLKIYDPLLKKINNKYKSSIIDTYLFSDLYAQPIIPINYSKIIPRFETPLKNIFLANIQQVYPWDRGINYAVELGKKIADHITSN